MMMLLISACTRTIQIKEIMDNPREYADRKVAVEGEVSGVFSLIVIKYFLVNDGTGEIGVVTEKAEEILQLLRTAEEAKEAGRTKAKEVGQQPQDR